MTCIVAIGDGTSVWIGGDAAGTAGLETTIRSDTKVFVNGPMIFGFAGSYRMGQLLRYALTVPKHYSDDGDDMKYLVVKFIAAVRSCLKEHGWGLTVTGDHENGREAGGIFVVGYKGTVYQVDSDFQVGWPSSNSASIGSGEEYANGVLYATSDLNPKERIKKALSAAAEFNAAVAAPFTILQHETKGD
jgi:ATP-dependent protease HslVU (ClpYQ) peptidase subunit